MNVKTQQDLECYISHYDLKKQTITYFLPWGDNFAMNVPKSKVDV